MLGFPFVFNEKNCFWSKIVLLGEALHIYYPQIFRSSEWNLSWFLCKFVWLASRISFISFPIHFYNGSLEPHARLCCSLEFFIQFYNRCDVVGCSLKISNLLFVNDTVIFSEPNLDNLCHLRAALFYFEAILDLKINLSK